MDVLAGATPALNRDTHCLYLTSYLPLLHVEVACVTCHIANCIGDVGAGLVRQSNYRIYCLRWGSSISESLAGHKQAGAIVG